LVLEEVQQLRRGRPQQQLAIHLEVHGLSFSRRGNALFLVVWFFAEVPVMLPAARCCRFNV